MILSPWYSNSRIYETPADYVAPCCNPPLYSRAEVILNFSSVSRKQNLHIPHRIYGARGGAVVWGTALQEGSSQVRSFPAALWPCSRLRLLTEIGTRNITLWQRRPVRRAYNLTTFMCRFVLKSGRLSLLESTEPVQPCTGIVLLLLTGVQISP